MKYRVRVDLSFDKEADAILLMNYAKVKAKFAVSINEGEPNEEISFVSSEICRHDEGGSCEMMERVVARKNLNG